MFASRAVGIWLALPAALFVVVVFLAPVVALLGEGFVGADGFSLQAYRAFFSEPLNIIVFVRTLRLGLEVTAAAAILGYAAAYAIVALPANSRGKMIGLVLLPMMVSPVARTYAWIVILGRTGIVNKALMAIGLTETPLRILFSETAIFIGLLQLFMPLMVISLVSALENLTRDVTEAARVLGANGLQAFWKIVLPLTREGLVVGGTLVFTGSLTAYITPAILGGSKVLMLETLMYQRVSVANDFVSASVIGLILIAMSFAANGLLRRVASARTRA